jgi:hypothetical protein
MDGSMKARAGFGEGARQQALPATVQRFPTSPGVRPSM